MKMLYRLLMWIDIGFAVVSAFALLRGLIQHDMGFAIKSLLAGGIWLSFAGFCYMQIRRLQLLADGMLEELRKLDYEEALTRARATSLRLPRGLVAEKVSARNNDWYAFERDEVQYIITRAEHGAKADIFEI